MCLSSLCHWGGKVLGSVILRLVSFYRHPGFIMGRIVSAIFFLFVVRVRDCCIILNWVDAFVFFF